MYQPNLEPPSYEETWEDYVANEREKRRQETAAYLDSIVGKGAGYAFGELLAFTYLEMPDQCKQILDSLKLSDISVFCYYEGSNSRFYEKELNKEFEGDFSWF